MNKVFLTNCYIGKKGVELRFTPGSGAAVATYSVAVPNYKKQGEKQTYTYINCVTWNKQAEFLANNAAKIKKVGIEGRINTRSYDAKDGTKKYVTEVITAEIEVEEWNNDIQPSTPSNENNQSGKDFNADVTEVLEDDIPF